MVFFFSFLTKVVVSLHALAVFWKRKTFVVFESEIYRRVCMNWGSFSGKIRQVHCLFSNQESISFKLFKGKHHSTLSHFQIKNFNSLLFGFQGFFNFILRAAAQSSCNL